MARPSKSAAIYNGKISKEDIKIRQENEQKLKGNDDKVKPPSYLNTGQKKIFRYIVKELEVSGILGNLDVFILSTAATSIYWMQEIDKQLNNNPELLTDRALMGQREKYTKDFFRCCNELSLSPQSRAKLGNINLQSQQQDDPVLQILKGDKT